MLQFGGSNCDRDTHHVLADVCGVDTDRVRYKDGLSRLNREGRVAFRFCDEHGNVTPESNPNGSAEKIAGLLSEGNNVLAMMPHPERASVPVLGLDDGVKIFNSMIPYIEEYGRQRVVQ
ncbi:MULTISPECIES: phosphoribosylformylglycinamidine synthase subunit PurQ [Methanoculleus]|nr:phosphoribosylformylglycinamidine synthase subunit PurQ [Methanoculleus submarinus]